jgi:F0F1-type ATP synthase epsilon subunit
MKLLTVRILSPLKTIFEGKAQVVSSQNSDGPFDILPEHANFMTLIENQPIKLTEEDGKQSSFQVSKAILMHANDAISIYVDPQIV